MERAAVLRRLSWQTGTVVGSSFETPRVKTITLAVPGWPGHRAGQHLDVRLTAPDGYRTERSYSIASGPEDENVSITVERLDDGEVSPFLVDELRAGDELEFRGPIGGHFVWDGDTAAPLFLIGGGSGVAPLRAMLRHHRARNSEAPVRLLYSARSRELLIYRTELSELGADDLIDVAITLTREAPDDWDGHRGRIDPALLAETGWPVGVQPLTYICGPTAFVETAARGLVGLGHDPARIRTERFGGTGG
ncbi:ferredoxin reductase [Kribbella sp. NPDC051770]|uniref:ferredoxin reductase n=1 Tax=Kribbella sp. NPDC051770 TaxID=3155413 RepID=UPI00341781CD